MTEKAGSGYKSKTLFLFFFFWHTTPRHVRSSIRRPCSSYTTNGSRRGHSTQGKSEGPTLILNNRVTNGGDHLHVALQLKDLGEHDLEDLGHVDRVRSRTEDEGGLHGLGKLSGLLGDLLLVRGILITEVIVLGTNEERGGGLVQETSLFVPTLDAGQRRFALTEPKRGKVW